MKASNDVTKYSPSLIMRIGNIGIAVCLIYLTGKHSYILIQTALTSGANGKWLYFLPVLAPLVLQVLLILFFLNWSPTLTLTQEGIRVQAFILYKVLVSWEDIISIRKCFIPWSRLSLIVVNRLTPIHRLFGLLYGPTLHPVIPIERYMHGSDEIIASVNEYLAEFSLTMAHYTPVYTGFARCVPRYMGL